MSLIATTVLVSCTYISGARTSPKYVKYFLIPIFWFSNDKTRIDMSHSWEQNIEETFKYCSLAEHW